jgi:hypothetical protein
MRPHSVPCCGESGRVRTSGHRTRPGTLTRPGQRRPIHPLGPQRMAHSRRRAALSITDGHGLHQPPGGKTGEIRAGAIVCTLSRPKIGFGSSPASPPGVRRRACIR